MKVKELIEELKGACPEYEDLDVCFFNEHWLMDVWRVLKSSGTLWINIGDTYDKKSLLNIPERLSVELSRRGWVKRNTIIWHKPNTMPISVKDRFTVDFEYLYFFSKNKKYFFNQQFEPSIDKEYRERGNIRLTNQGRKGFEIRGGVTSASRRKEK